MNLCDENSGCLKCDIYEKNDKYFIECEVPGFKKEQINLSYDNDYLTISCFKEESNMEYIRKEIVNKYERSFYVRNIDKDKIFAKYNNGILLIELGKLENNSKFNIEIK